MSFEEVIELREHLFPTPCTISLVGPSGSGKTTLLMDGLLKFRHQLFGPAPVTHVLYFYGEDQPAFAQKRAEEGDAIQFYRGLPTREQFETLIERFEGHHFLVVLDDLMDEMAQSPLGQDIFTKMSHHRYATACYQHISCTIIYVFGVIKCQTTFCLVCEHYFNQEIPTIVD